jgi:hypothetical protein
VIFPRVLLAFRHAPSLTSSLNLVEVETLPSGQVVLSCPSLGLRPIGTMASSDFSSGILQDFTLRLIPSVSVVLCHRPDETSPVSSPTFATSHTPYTGEFFTAVSGSMPLLLPSPCVTGSALSCSPYGANMSVLQVSLYVTGYCFASLSQGVTTLRHSQSPNCIGCLLPGGLTLTRTGLSPASRR